MGIFQQSSWLTRSSSLHNALCLIELIAFLIERETLLEEGVMLAETPNAIRQVRQIEKYACDRRKVRRTVLTAVLNRQYECAICRIICHQAESQISTQENSTGIKVITRV